MKSSVKSCIIYLLIIRFHLSWLVLNFLKYLILIKLYYIIHPTWYYNYFIRNIQQTTKYNFILCLSRYLYGAIIKTVTKTKD